MMHQASQKLDSQYLILAIFMHSMRMPRAERNPQQLTVFSYRS